MVIGGLFKINNSTPIFTIPKKAAYMAADLDYVTSALGIPFKMRTEFIFKPITSLRATLAVPQGPERGKAVKALFHGAWAQDLDLGDAEVVVRLLNEAGLDGQTLVERTQDEAIKNELKENTDQADALGIFGAPSFVVNAGERMFWGHDRLDMLDHYLKTH